jgi:peptidoglycan glycosyltransferase
VNKKIRQLAFGMMVLYVLLFAATNYWQVGRASDLNGDPDNYRAIRREFDRPRGDIITADGVVVAHSVPNPQGSTFPFHREYPLGTLYAGVTGYYSFGYGATQVERTQNSELTGQTGQQYIGNLEDIVRGGDGTGDVWLTIDSDLQETARDALAGRNGSVVMLDMDGRILAMYSNPTYDPNVIVNPDFDVAGEAMQALLADEDDPLLNHAYQERFMPGSTFKVITTGIALQAGVISLDTEFDRVTEWTPPQTSNPIQNYDGSNCGGDLREVFRRSCNIPFAQTALEVGIDGMIAGTQAWGIGQPIPIDLPRPAASTFGSTDNLDQQLPIVAMRGFGQQEDQMVPLHMAMVAQTVANGGEMMEPFVVDHTTDSQQRTLTRTSPQVWLRPISSQTAATLNELMQGVVTDGTASCCLGISGIRIAAKTGTAQLNDSGQPEESHAWIIAFAPADNPRFAVAVMLEAQPEVSASTGGRLAGPIAQRMLETAFAG